VKLAWAVALALLPASALAQEQTLDVLDGETLFEGGWLLTFNYEVNRKQGLLDGSHHVSDPVDRRQTDQTWTLSGHYGLRNDLQLSLLVPYVSRVLELQDPFGPDRFSSEGLGDVEALVKWRFYRWDAPHKALNLSVLGGLELPTGSDDEKDHGIQLPPQLQPGSGSIDPILGLASTYEPGRWRFNALALYKLNTENDDDFRFGDQLLAELAVGNRFWLEPYPGPFMRADLMLRYRSEGRSTMDGDTVPSTGGQLVTAGANLAFRPRPSLDFQLAVEIPIHEDVNGIQLAQDFRVSFSFGFRF
jgi:outer membrane putative beta-barrel porin/alpha-amylase